jgi:hypothetical protein
MMATRRNVTDRAHRYRANALAPSGPKVCAWCGSRQNITVDHKDGWPDHTRRSNLQYLCKSCNTAKGIAFREAGRGRPTKQYNPAEGVPTFQQYAWAVSTGERDEYQTSSRHAAGAHDEAGAIIHATPKHLRSEYARRIASAARRTRRARSEDRWNSAHRENAFWDTKSTHYTRASGGKFQRVEGGDVRAAKRASVAEARREKREAAAAERKRKADKRRADMLNRQFIRRQEQEERKRERAKSKAQKQAEALQREFEPSYRKSRDVPTKRRMSDKGILAELMRENPKNPAKFDRCVEAVQKKGGAANAYAVCTAAGTRQNPGWKRFFSAGKKAAASGRYVNAKDAWIEYTSTHIPPKGYQTKGTRSYVRRYEARDAFVEGFNSKKNPADAAAEAFEDFHGHASEEVVTVTKKIHRHDHLAAAGELRRIKVDGIDGYRHTIGGLDGAILAFNEARNQLFIEGGDQSLNLNDWGIRKPHEVETLGKVTELDYFTTKTHLGKEGGTAVYNHRLRTTNQDGRHVVVTIARYPDLIYRVLDQQLEFSGGSYIIRAEGIDK